MPGSKTSEALEMFAACPCGSGLAYTECCAPCHRGLSFPATAEQLMRSRFSAYACQQVDYLVETTHPDTRHGRLAVDIAAWAEQAEFHRLEVLKTVQGGPADKVGKVEFIAHFRQQGRLQKLHEVSRFKRYKKRWMYVDGQLMED